MTVKVIILVKDTEGNSVGSHFAEIKLLDPEQKLPLEFSFEGKTYSIHKHENT